MRRSIGPTQTKTIQLVLFSVQDGMPPALENLPHIKAAEYIRQLPDKKILEEKLASSRLLLESLNLSSSSGFEAEDKE